MATSELETVGVLVCLARIVQGAIIPVPVAIQTKTKATQMTNDPTKPPPLDGNDSSSESMTFYDKSPQPYEHAAAISHDSLDDMRKRLIVLEGMQQSAPCQRGWLVVAIALLFAALVALAWVML